ncbi:3-oxoacyl-[acyl-carrier protein] reductase [Pseudoclavibacter sp. JAI123]|uniref:SDR family NAD(P)-dependent oxidoreductase n=1 Tax=Pseudoclavibacter sp. JAI123 TaxID=2723065 RepID=UPI0015C69C5F|nr:SDR family oxidoreductase [Pseudoclavibacter sp. JAI123]NYF14229.1 3-oxoacyl-[acyl-carrier protein] reductase [Pseudoclavibacter sp. JAI123]
MDAHTTTVRVAIVTGGSRGLGRVMALALRAEGYAVTITASGTSAALDEVVADAAKLPGGAELLLPLIADVGDPNRAREVVDATAERFGGVHALVNNAGRGMRLVSETFTTDPVHFWDVPPATWAQIIETNVNGPFVMSQAVMPRFLAQGDGRIVNVSTSAQTMVRPGYAPYGPSKAALEAMTRSWATDLAGTGVTANLLLPGGAADTELLPAGPDRKGADGNLLSPEVMAAPAVWLCSPESANVSGARIIAKLWDPTLSADEAFAAASSAHVVAG